MVLRTDRLTPVGFGSTGRLSHSRQGGSVSGEVRHPATPPLTAASGRGQTAPSNLIDEGCHEPANKVSVHRSDGVSFDLVDAVRQLWRRRSREASDRGRLLLPEGRQG